MKVQGIGIDAPVISIMTPVPESITDICERAPVMFRLIQQNLTEKEVTMDLFTTPSTGLAIGILVTRIAMEIIKEAEMEEQTKIIPVSCRGSFCTCFCWSLAGNRKNFSSES